MTNSIRYFLFLCAVLLSIVWAACTQERSPCLTPKVASFNIECIHLLTDTSLTTVDTALPAAVFEALTNTGVKGILYPTQSTFTISLSSVSDTCKWAFTTDTIGTRFDTLTFFYQRKLQFLSNACGYTYFYNLDSVHTTHINIDSVYIANTNVTNNVNTTHLQIYIHPDY